jgi:flagella basal body P-ring formation protein FlgA
MIIMRAVKVLFLTVLVFATATLAAEAAKADTPRPGPIVVDGPWVTLGDLFDLAGAVADVHVSASPSPGQSMTLAVREIAAIANANGIDWTPGGVTGLTVERAGDLVPRTLILTTLADALSATSQRNMAPEISNSSFAMYVTRGAGKSVAVENLDFDPTRGNFSAILVAPAGDPTAVRVVVRGRAYEVVEVPVLIRAVAVGGVITDSDLGWVNMRVDRIRSNMITEYTGLAGQSPKRPLRINEPVRNTDVQRPVVIAKGETIMMIVEAPGIFLTVIGRALADAGAGEAIQVVNTQTHKTVEGIVSGPGQVRIYLHKTLVQAQN